eukprot:TRINITY_DN1691_c0_g1_i1.p1 TRINITY_DN1691_c0_g1~~TRINITY_DN1691_c0_g1_i1.p1  ORF type:complete len:266 (+),score=7.73 TRINITY_DN1691_c0_g1_i1:94-798(+)
MCIRDSSHCSGPSPSDCLEVVLPVTGGVCKIACSPGYFLEQRTCKCLPCPSRCAECSGPHSDDCIKRQAPCSLKALPGEYVSRDCSIQKCPNNCEICTGPSNYECHKFKPPAQCLLGCRAGQVQAYPCDCIDCALGCESCTGPWPSQCLKWMLDCKLACPVGTYKIKGTCICKPCPSDCPRCGGPAEEQCSIQGLRMIIYCGCIYWMEFYMQFTRCYICSLPGFSMHNVVKCFS